MQQVIKTLYQSCGLYTVYLSHFRFMMRVKREYIFFIIFTRLMEKMPYRIKAYSTIHKQKIKKYHRQVWADGTQQINKNKPNNGIYSFEVIKTHINRENY